MSENESGGSNDNCDDYGLWQMPFTIRVSPCVFRRYKLMNDYQKRLFREALKQFMATAITNISNVNLQQQKTVIVNVNMPVNVQVNSVNGGQQTDEVTAERIRLLEEKNEELREVLDEYKKKLEKYEEIMRYVNAYKNKYIDYKMLIANILNALGIKV